MQFAVVLKRQFWIVVPPISSFLLKKTATNQSILSSNMPTTTSISYFHSYNNNNNSSKSLSNPSFRSFSGEPGSDHNKEIDEINLKFAEAREEIEAAMESKETVYFDEEAECARDAVKDVLGLFNQLLAKSPHNQKAALQRAMGLKIEQLKAELAQLNE